MATRRTSFGKLQRDRAKQATAAAKRERRQDRASAADAEVEVMIPAEGELSAAELIKLIEQIHQQYDSKQIDFETFEEKKAELLARLPVE